MEEQKDGGTEGETPHPNPRNGCAHRRRRTDGEKKRKTTKFRKLMRDCWTRKIEMLYIYILNIREKNSDTFEINKILSKKGKDA